METILIVIVGLIVVIVAIAAFGALMIAGAIFASFVGAALEILGFVMKASVMMPVIVIASALEWIRGKIRQCVAFVRRRPKQL